MTVGLRSLQGGGEGERRWRSLHETARTSRGHKQRVGGGLGDTVSFDGIDHKPSWDVLVHIQPEQGERTERSEHVERESLRADTRARTPQRHARTAWSLPPARSPHHDLWRAAYKCSAAQSPPPAELHCLRQPERGEDKVRKYTRVYTKGTEKVKASHCAQTRAHAHLSGTSARRGPCGLRVRRIIILQTSLHRLRCMRRSRRRLLALRNSIISLNLSAGETRSGKQNMAGKASTRKKS